jgi:hypothetical protein
MKKIRIISVYTWAIICMILIPATFMGNAGFSALVAKLPFMKINPVYSGGSIDRSYEKQNLKITVNKPVFESIFGKSKDGFVQIRFSPQNSLPSIINDTIDFNHDGSTDFRLIIDTKSGKTFLKALNSNVLGLNVSSKVKNDWIVRVNVLNLQTGK